MKSANTASLASGTRAPSSLPGILASFLQGSRLLTPALPQRARDLEPHSPENTLKIYSQGLQNPKGPAALAQSFGDTKPVFSVL